VEVVCELDPVRIGISVIWPGVIYKHTRSTDKTNPMRIGLKQATDSTRTSFRTWWTL